MKRESPTTSLAFETLIPYESIRRYSSCPALAEEKQKRDKANEEGECRRKAHLQELTNTQAPFLSISTITIIFGPVASMGAAGRRIYPALERIILRGPNILRCVNESAGEIGGCP